MLYAFFLLNIFILSLKKNVIFTRMLKFGQNLMNYEISNFGISKVHSIKSPYFLIQIYKKIIFFKRKIISFIQVSNIFDKNI